MLILTLLCLPLVCLAQSVKVVSTEQELRRLVQILTTEKDAPEKQLAAMKALKKIGKDAVPALVGAVNNGDWVYKQLVVGTVGEMSDIPEAVHALVQLLRDEDPSIHRIAARALKTAGKKVAAETTALTRMALEGNREAADVLIGIGGPSQEEMPALTSGLQEEDWQIRNVAADLVAIIGQPAVPVILAMVKNEKIDPATAAGIFSKMDPPAVQALVSMLEMKAHIDRSYLIDTLGGKGAKSAAAVPVLVKFLTDPDERVRAAAARALGAIGPGAAEAVPELITALDDSVNSVSSSAAYALGKLGSAARPAVRRLLEALKERRSRTEAIIALGHIGGSSGTVIQRLGTFLEPSRDTVCYREVVTPSDAYRRCDLYAAAALGDIGPAAAKTVPALIAMLKSTPGPGYEPYDIGAYQKIIVSALEKIGTAEGLAAAHRYGPKISKIIEKIKPYAPLPEVIGYIEDPDLLTRRYALEQVARRAGEDISRKLLSSNQRPTSVDLGDDPVYKDSIPALIRALKEPQLKLHALISLSCIGTPDALAAIQPLKETIPDLVAALAGNSEKSLHWALVRFGRDAVPELAKYIKDDKPTGFYNIYYVLLAIGPDAKEAIPVLLSVLRSKVRFMPILAAEALVRIGSEGICGLVSEFQSEDVEVRIAAIRAFARTRGNINNTPVLKEALPALKKALNDKNDTVRFYAAYSISRLSPEAVEAVPVLVEALRNKPELRQAAIDALGGFGAGAKSAIPDLLLNLKNDTGKASINTIKALSRIGIDPEVIIPELINTLGDMHVRREGIDEVVRIGKAVVPELVRALKTGDRLTVLGAAYALAKIGPEAQEAMPALTVALGSDDQRIRLRSAYAISRIRPDVKETALILLKALHGRNPTEKCLAAYGLAGFNYSDVEELPGIMNALCSENDGFNFSSPDPSLIYFFQWDKKEVTAYLKRALRHANPAVQEAATMALRRWEQDFWK